MKIYVLSGRDDAELQEPKVYTEKEKAVTAMKNIVAETFKDVLMTWDCDLTVEFEDDGMESKTADEIIQRGVDHDAINNSNPDNIFLNFTEDLFMIEYMVSEIDFEPTM